MIGATKIGGWSNVGRALLASGTVNVLVFLALGSLNSPDILPNKRLPDIAPILTLKDCTEEYKSEVTEPSPLPMSSLPPEPEIMTVNLDLPMPQPVPIAPIATEILVPEFAIPLSHKLLVESNSSVRLRQTVSCLGGTGTSVSSQPHRKDMSVLKPPSPPYSAASVDMPPKELANTPPRYPPRALARGIEGYVVVKLLLGENGTVEDVQIMEVAGDEAFRQAVCDVVGKWRFTPARHRGRAVKVWAIKRIRFELEQ